MRLIIVFLVFSWRLEILRLIIVMPVYFCLENGYLETDYCIPSILLENGDLETDANLISILLSDIIAQLSSNLTPEKVSY